MSPIVFPSKKSEEIVPVKEVGSVPSSVAGTVSDPVKFTEDVKKASSVNKDKLHEHSDFKESAELVEKARDGRDVSDIPLDDPYWGVVNAHRLNHNKK